MEYKELFNNLHSQLGIQYERKAWNWLWVLFLICILRKVRLQLWKCCVSLCDEQVFAIRFHVLDVLLISYLLHVLFKSLILPNFSVCSDKTVLLVVFWAFIFHLWFTTIFCPFSKLYCLDTLHNFSVVCNCEDFYWFQMRTCETLEPRIHCSWDLWIKKEELWAYYLLLLLNTMKIPLSFMDRQLVVHDFLLVRTN